MTGEVTSQRAMWLWCIFFGLLAVLLAVYQLVAYFNQGLFEPKIFVIFCVSAFGLALAIYLLRHSRRYDSRSLTGRGDR